jgi:hypothetical protein
MYYLKKYSSEECANNMVEARRLTSFANPKSASFTDPFA